jgi:hypothetical protein
MPRSSYLVQRSTPHALLVRAAPLVLSLVLSSCRDAASPAVLQPITGRSPNSVEFSAALVTFYGPERFTRERGKPAEFVREIPTAEFEAPFVLHVRSGDATGEHRVSSATVELDGATVLGPSDFNQQRDAWDISVSPAEAARLSVSIASAPESFLEISIEGKRRATLFCPDGRPGSIPDLSDAVAATPVNGTVLVCDGLHNIDQELINKPITLRSQNPGGATLGDTDPNPVPSFGRPAIWIDDVVSGLVRITDINFEVRGRAIATGGGVTSRWDKIEIDGVRFIGRDATKATPVVINRSHVPGARVNVTNSYFADAFIPVQFIDAIEANVRGSTFERITNSVIRYGTVTSTGAPPRGAFGRIEGNIMRGCGNQGCIRATTSNLVIVNNTIEVLGTPRPFSAILVSRLPGFASAEPIVVENNTIVGSALDGDPKNMFSWTMPLGIELNDGMGLKGVVSANQLTNIHTGFHFSSGVDARDNVVTGGAYVLRVATPSPVNFERNNVVGLAASFDQVPTTGASLRCNWWGSLAGPTSPNPFLPATVYAPWAQEPIAGTSVACDPDAGLVTVRVCSTPGSVFTVPTLAQAVKLVTTGGTIPVCDGTHSSPGVSISRSMTIQSAGPGVATLDAVTAGLALHVGNSGAGSTVALRNLRFVGGTFANVFVGGNIGEFIASGNEFNPPATAPYGGQRGWLSGLQVGGSDIGTATVSNNVFNGGDIGYHVNSQSGTHNVAGNTFRAQNNSSIHIAGPRPGPVTIDDNTFEGCGPDWCLFTQHGVTFTRNTVTIDIARPSLSPLNIDNFSGGESVVTNNVITGTGAGGSDRSAQSTYPIRSHAIKVLGGGTVTRNQVTNAYVALGPTSSLVSGTDNVFDHTFAPFFGGGPATITRSDLLDYVVTNTNALSPMNLKCNYWDSPDGPPNAGGFESVFMPFSPEPIANRPNVECTP